MYSWFAHSWFSCRKFAERLSRQMDEPLSPYERLAYCFHFLWCVECRRFKAQLERLQGGLREFSRRVLEDRLEGDADLDALSPETTQRLKTLLKQPPAPPSGQ